MSGRLVRGLLVAGCLVLMTGCGPEATVLTSEEAQIITAYSAKVVAKHNVRLGQGILRYRGKEEVEEESEEESEEEVSEDTEESEEETVEASSRGSEKSETKEEEEKNPVREVSMSKALGVSGITFNYNGASIPSDLRLSDFYTLPDPPIGKNYVSVAFQAVNTTSDDITFSVVSLQPTFTATLNGESSRAEILLYGDLSTYEGTIQAGGSEDLILLFQFSEDAVSDLSSLDLNVTIDGTDNRIILQ